MEKQLMSKKVAVIIPTFNESKNIKSLILAIKDVILNVEIVIVDDNSPDNTKKIVSSLQKSHKNVHLLVRQSKNGRGSAVIDGINYIRKLKNPSIFIEMDADFSHDPSELLTLIEHSKPNTVVIASRYLPKSRIVNVPLKRRVLSFFSNIFIRKVLNMYLSDYTNGYRCYPEKAIQILQNHAFITKGYITLSESAFVLHKKGFKFKEIPSTFVYRKRGKSNTTFSEFTDAASNILKIRGIRV